MYIKSLLFFIIALQFGNAMAQQNIKVIVEAQKRVPDTGIQKEKNSGIWEKFETRTVSGLKDFKPVGQSTEFSKYGGWLEKQDVATGFFYTKKIDDRWWLIDPEGYYFIHSAMNSVHPGESDRNKAAFQDVFGDKEQWTSQTKDVLRQHGFNGLGVWSDTEAFRESPSSDEKPLAYTLVWNFMSAYAKKRGLTYITPGHTGFSNDVIYVFDPEFESFCDSYAERIAEYKDDNNLLGHFSDNELPFLLSNIDGYLSLSKDEPGYQAAQKWLKDRNIGEAEITEEHRHEFLAHVADKYFSIVSKALKKHDPNHLFLGSRFHSKERHYEKFLKAASKHIDVLSINYYRVWTPEKDRMEEWETWMNKPFMITEYYVKGQDSGLPNKSGAGWLVKTQKDRGLFYQNFNLALLEAGNCVGWHYFKYQDNDPEQEGAELSNIDSNKGIADNQYKLYEPMTNLMKELNLNRYQLIDYFDHKKQAGKL